MTMSAEVAALWSRYRSLAGLEVDALPLEVFAFGDSASMADELGALVVAGTKRATAGSWASYEREGLSPPKPGDLSIVIDSKGAPLCVIQTTRVDVQPFSAVDAEFAATEGEGDGSLAFWRIAHEAYFGRECARLGIGFSREMLVLCERFEVVLLAHAG